MINISAKYSERATGLSFISLKVLYFILLLVHVDQQEIIFYEEASGVCFYIECWLTFPCS